jgi:hypothetical protein
MNKIIKMYEGEPSRPAPKKRGVHRRTATKTEIERVVRTATELGLTIYGLTVEGERIQIQTRPGPDLNAGARPAVDAWFDRRG